MKWLGLILSFVMGRINNSKAPAFSLKDSALAIYDEITFKSRRVVGLMLAGLGCVIFACGGFFISLIDATTQFDKEGGIRLTSTLSAGIILVLLAAGIVAWIFGSAWPGVAQLKEIPREEAPRPQASSLEQALSLLVMDFVREREFKREHRPPGPPAPHHPPHHEPPHGPHEHENPPHMH